MVNHHLVIFGGHGHCGSGDIRVSVCHMIFQDYVTKYLSNFMDSSTLSKSLFCQAWWP